VSGRLLVNCFYAHPVGHAIEALLADAMDPAAVFSFDRIHERHLRAQ
jgi:hypothetical protein